MVARTADHDGSGTKIAGMDTTIDDSTRRRLVLVARSGYVVSGLLHVAIGVIAARIALGSGGEASSSGALGTMASNPFGQSLLWVAVLALVALGAWQLFQAWEDARDGAAGGLAGAKGDPKDTGRDAVSAVKNAAKGVVYLALAFTTATFAAGGSSSEDAKSQDLTATVMGLPGGRWLIGAVGLGVVAVGVYHVVSGITGRFLENLHGLPRPPGGRVARILGHVGYVAKGVALGVVGALFVIAAVQADPSDAGGMDKGLRTLGEQPFGQVLLIAVGLGFVACGLFSVVRARYAAD